MAFSSGELWRNRIHRVVIHLCSPLLCQTSWLQRQLLKDGIILLTIFVGIVSVQHQVLTISLSHGIVTRTELVYRMLVTLLYVSKQWGVVTDDRSTLTFLLPFSNSDYFYAAFPTNKVKTGGINLHGVRHPTYLELYSSISNNSNTANNWQFSDRNINPCWLAVGI